MAKSTNQNSYPDFYYAADGQPETIKGINLGAKKRRGVSRKEALKLDAGTVYEEEDKIIELLGERSPVPNNLQYGLGISDSGVDAERVWE